MAKSELPAAVLLNSYEIEAYSMHIMSTKKTELLLLEKNYMQKWNPEIKWINMHFNRMNTETLEE